jgi:hypothetical protein
MVKRSFTRYEYNGNAPRIQQKPEYYLTAIKLITKDIISTYKGKRHLEDAIPVIRTRFANIEGIIRDAEQSEELRKRIRNIRDPYLTREDTVNYLLNYLYNKDLFIEENLVRDAVARLPRENEKPTD